MNKALDTKKGFSLLEIVVYIAILVLMVGVILDITVSVVRSQRAIKASKSIENSAIVSIERISREIRKADSIDTVTSILDSNPGRIVLNGKDPNGNPRVVEFYLDASTIFLKENGIDLGPISQPDARVNSLVFRLFSNSDLMGVRTETAIESGTSTHYRADNFYSSATIR